MHDISDLSVNPLPLQQSCTKPSICTWMTVLVMVSSFADISFHSTTCVCHHEGLGMPPCSCKFWHLWPEVLLENSPGKTSWTRFMFLFITSSVIQMNGVFYSSNNLYLWLSLIHENILVQEIYHIKLSVPGIFNSKCFCCPPNSYFSVMLFSQFIHSFISVVRLYNT